MQVVRPYCVPGNTKFPETYFVSASEGLTYDPTCDSDYERRDCDT